MIVTAQWLLLAAWTVVIAVFAGWGVLMRRLWREPLRADAGDVLLTFWIGWATVLLILQVWHFALPIRDAARVVILVGGVLGLLSAWRAAWRLLLRVHRRLPLVAVGAALAMWLANRATEGPRFGDTGGYYVPTIRWVIEYPVVIGLANLYPPYAYNQTYFLYAALLDASAFAGRTHHLLNSALLAVLVARSVVALWRVLRRRGTATAVDVFYVLMLPAEADAATGYLLTSPAPDFGVFVFGVALCGELVALLERDPTGRTPARMRLHFLSLMLLAALAPTLKLSAFGLAAMAMLVGIAVWLRRARPWRQATQGLLVAAALGALAIVPWIAGNVLMSGCPFFPTAIGALAVPWKVDWDVQQWIQNTMIVGDWKTVVRAPNWVAQRFVALGWTAATVAVPLCIALAALLVGGSARVLRGRGVGGVSFAVVLPPLASLVFCIATTPVPRYAAATMWLLAACSVIAAFGDRLRAPLARYLSALGAVALTALPFLSGAQPWLHLRDFPPLPRPPYETQQLASGLEVTVPAKGGHSCWSAPLPCTPRVHQGLRLRQPGDLGSGFEVAVPPP